MSEGTTRPADAPGVRCVELRRKTNETEIDITLSLDGAGTSEIETGIGFFDHMLTHVAKHGLLDLTLKARGDLHVDDHHTVEDVGILLGQAIDRALGDRAGIVRFGHAVVPMDEALVHCAIDISGRGMSVCELSMTTERIGNFATEMVPEFFRAVATNAKLTVHLRQDAGSNAHHVAEAGFKAFGRALAQAVERSSRITGIPSTKGVL